MTEASALWVEERAVEIMNEPTKPPATLRLDHSSSLEGGNGRWETADTLKMILINIFLPRALLAQPPLSQKQQEQQKGSSWTPLVVGANCSNISNRSNNSHAKTLPCNTCSDCQCSSENDSSTTAISAVATRTLITDAEYSQQQSLQQPNRTGRRHIITREVWTRRLTMLGSCCKICQRANSLMWSLGGFLHSQSAPYRWCR